MEHNEILFKSVLLIMYMSRTGATKSNSSEVFDHLTKNPALNFTGEKCFVLVNMPL